MSDFLLELRSEEIPARMQARARAELEKLFRKEMDAAGLAVGEVTVWSTPRRLALIAHDLPVATEAVSEEVKGPRTSAPEQALEGFLRKTGLSKEQLTERDGVWFAVTEKPGRLTRDVLAEAIPAIVRSFAWPKSMRWGAPSLSTESLRWVRPLSGIVALFDQDVVDCEVGGVRSGQVTSGHRFHFSGDVVIGSARDYADRLRQAHVIVDHAEREALIRERAKAVADEAGLVLVEDEGLVIENAGLTEWPVPLLGRFDEAFLEVPPEVIQLTARVNQKYFVCEDAQGKLANAFVCTANIDAIDGGIEVVDGNRKVLAARLSDARFFWDQDRKVPLEVQAKKLERITFHEKLGTVADKVKRVAKLARWLVEEGIVTPDGALAKAEASGNDAHPAKVSAFAGTREELADMAEQAAKLCKADLVTEMVGEFPELQGIMGGYYARAEGLPDEVADAIRDHYKPVGQGDEVPTAPVTVAVSLADKLDTLVGFFASRYPPTGSKDPFALRRAAIAAIQIILRNSLKISISALLSASYRALAEVTLPELFMMDGEIGQRHIHFWVRSIYVDEGQASSEKFVYYPLDFDRSGWEDFEIGQTIGVVEYGKVLDDLNTLDDEFVGTFSTFRDLNENLSTFFADRLKVQQREAGVRHDLIDAVFALGGEDDLVRLLARVHALQAFIGTEDGANLLAGYKRAANILKKEGFSAAAAIVPPDGEEDPLVMVDDPDMREIAAEYMHGQNSLSYTPEPAEKALMDALDTAEPQADAAVAAEDFTAAMAALASLRAPIDAFFEGVTVNDADPAKRTARLGLLDRFRAAVHKVADFSRIEG